VPLQHSRLITAVRQKRKVLELVQVSDAAPEKNDPQ
jgi:hypothetical protein